MIPVKKQNSGVHRAVLSTILITSGIPVGCGTAEPDATTVPTSHGSDIVMSERAVTSEAGSDPGHSAPGLNKDRTPADDAGPVPEGEGVVDADFESQSSRQSGLLTAGSFDDVASFGDYMTFLQRHQHQAKQCGLPVRPTSQQTIISVRDVEGRGVGNVRCVVRDTSSERVLLDGTTGTDGRLMLLTDRVDHHPRQQRQVQLQVFTESAKQPVIDDLRTIERNWDVTVRNVQAQSPLWLDLSLVVDTTGSMGDELEYLKTEIDSIVQTVHRMFPDVDQRYSLITYRDNGDEYVCRTLDFTNSLSDFRRHLNAESADGGGDFPEAMDVALDAAGQLTWREGNVARVLFLVGDAPPHQQKLSRAVRAVEGLGRRGVRMFPIAASGVESTAEVVMRTASLLTMGQYLFLTDHSGIGNPHATPDVPEFAVERLDRLMVRMIASELAGRRLATREVIAIEQGDRYSYTPVAPAHPQTRRPVAVGPMEPASIADCTVSTSSVFGLALDWIAQHVLATLVAVVAGVVVFDQLAKYRVAR